MISIANGHANSERGESRAELLRRLADADAEYYSRRRQREPQSSYASGESDRMNPVPRGIDPLGTDADYHYRTERNYFLHVERGRAAVRNHPLVEQGINRLIANLGLGDFTLDPDSGDRSFDADLRSKWTDWCEDKQTCDFEQRRTFRQIACQSFFSQAQDGDITHLPLIEGSLQTFESHLLRSPFGHRPTGSSRNGIIHGVEVVDGRVQAYWLTPHHLRWHERLAARRQSQRFAAFDDEGNQLVFWVGFTHRFAQRRGISRLSAPRDAMHGFDDLNYAHTKSALRRALISYLMSSTVPPEATLPLGGAKLPQGGDRYVEDGKLGLKSEVVEFAGEPAQVFKTPEGYKLEGWNANMPTASFFEHAALMLTMLAVNLELPLMMFLLDGSLVNFHGGRMTWDQVKLRLRELQKDQIEGLHNPTFEWKLRQWSTPGSRQFDPAIAAQMQRLEGKLAFRFRPRGWPYVKPLEDAAGEDLAERRNLRSMRAILADRGVDHDDHVAEVIRDRGYWAREAIKEAVKIRDEFPEAEIDVPRFFRELWYGNEPSGVQLAVSADSAGETKAAVTQTPRGGADG